MLIRIIISPADENRSGANQMRQHLSFREHFKRGNADFIDAVVRLVEAPEERAVLGRNARAYAEREFDIARIAEVFERIITKPLRAATPGSKA